MIESLSITDPAKELADLGERLFFSKHPAEMPAFQVIADMAGLPPDSIQVLKIYSAVTNRILDFKEFVEGIDDRFVTPLIRRNMINSINKFGMVFHPKYSSQQWNWIKNNFLDENVITNFQHFSRTAQHYRPLKKIDDNDRTVVLHEILNIINSGDLYDIPVWARAPLMSGLKELHFILENIEFFGHNAAIESILVLHSRGEAIQREVLVNSDPANVSESNSLRKVLKVAIIAGTLFCLPDQIDQAYKKYNGWLFGSAATEIQQQAEIKLLGA